MWWERDVKRYLRDATVIGVVSQVDGGTFLSKERSFMVMQDEGFDHGCFADLPFLRVVERE
jgi:hypothetical protein